METTLSEILHYAHYKRRTFLYLARRKDVKLNGVSISQTD